MNIGLIFAGGTGERMNSRTKPKQFLELHGKPIIIYTLEIFENHPDIDRIVVVCLEDWIEQLKVMINRDGIKKVSSIVPGGKNTQESQYNGLKEIERWGVPDETVVLIHDGVRPLVDYETISRNIEGVQQYGSAITVTAAIETIVYVDNAERMNEIIDRKSCRMAKAPQSYYFKDILSIHEKAKNDRNVFIDSACMMQAYGKELHTVEGNDDNIKITTPKDYYLFKAIIDAKENSFVWGVN